MMASIIVTAPISLFIWAALIFKRECIAPNQKEYYKDHPKEAVARGVSFLLALLCYTIIVIEVCFKL